MERPFRTPFPSQPAVPSSFLSCRCKYGQSNICTHNSGGVSYVLPYLSARITDVQKCLFDLLRPHLPNPHRCSCCLHRILLPSGPPVEGSGDPRSRDHPRSNVPKDWQALRGDCGQNNYSPQATETSHSALGAVAREI